MREAMTADRAEQIAHGIVMACRGEAYEEALVISVARDLRSYAAERVAAAVAQERERLREVMLQSYLGITVLRTMCKKAGLTAGAQTADENLANMAAVLPELPGMSSLRSRAPTAGESVGGLPTAEGDA